MLLSLSVKNFTLIESLNLDFGSGFHAISGETGAGKSLIIKSILFALGFTRNNNDVVRPGAEYASAVLEFKISESLVCILDHYGISTDEHLFIKKQQFANNKKKYFINNELTSHKVVSAIADHLVEIHGQNGYSRLLNPNEHLRILDTYGDLIEDRKRLEEIFYQYQKTSQEMRDVIDHQGIILREIDYLGFVVEELKQKCPKKGEEAQLAELRSKLRNKSKKSEIISEIDKIYNNSNISSATNSISRLISKNADQSLKGLSENVDQLQILLSEIEVEIAKAQSDDIDGDLNLVESRLFEIRELARKYQTEPDDLALFLEKSQNNLTSLKEKLENSDKLSEELEEIKELYLIKASDLTRRRSSVAAKLEKAIKKELKPLKMEETEFMIQITSKSEGELSARGMDNVRFIASINPGSGLMPIEKCASGGEMARLMLAIRIALFDKSGASTIIFDEIDTGMGGVTADAVGSRIKCLSEIVQTIIITHQPQVASKADYNIFVSKESSKDSTISVAKMLNEEEKRSEIARMISGSEITEKSIQAATELIDQ